MYASEYLLTCREVERALRYPQGRAARLAKAGKLPAIFLPDGEIRFRQGDIDAIFRCAAEGGDDGH